MKERPILFSGPMIRALLSGQKTQTRRVVKWRGLAPGLNLAFSGLRAVRDCAGMWALESDTRTSSEIRCDVTPCPHGQPGDRLWVRETWARNWNQLSETRMDRSYVYRADGEERAQDNGCDLPWKPSIHMPRAASRITLEITDVRVERLQAISGEDARAEGCSGGHGAIPGYAYNATPGEQFIQLWKSINGAESWDANPWVWVISFRRVASASSEGGSKP